MTRLALALLLLGCGSRRPDVSAETPPDERPARTMRLAPTDPAGAAGMVIAIRDGDGPWQELDANGDLTFAITARRYSVAYACPLKGTAVYISHVSVEDDPVEIFPCREKEVARIRGSVRNAQGAVMVSSMFFAQAVNADGTFEAHARPGIRDLIILDGEGDRRFAWSTRGLEIVRGLDLSGADATVDVKVDLADAIELRHVEMSIEGLGDTETGQLEAILRTGNGGLMKLSIDRAPPFVADLPPDGALPAGDEIMLIASADADGRTRRARRDGDRWVLGADLGEVAATLVDGAPPRVLLSWPRYDGATSYTVSVMQVPRCTREAGCELVAWIAQISAAYVGDSGWVSFETPAFDLPALASFALVADQEIRWDVRAGVPDPATSSSLGAGRDGTIAP